MLAFAARRERAARPRAIHIDEQTGVTRMASRSTAAIGPVGGHKTWWCPALPRCDAPVRGFAGARRYARSFSLERDAPLALRRCDPCLARGADCPTRMDCRLRAAPPWSLAFRRKSSPTMPALRSSTRSPPRVRRYRQCPEEMRPAGLGGATVLSPINRRSRAAWAQDFRGRARPANILPARSPLYQRRGRDGRI